MLGGQDFEDESTDTTITVPIAVPGGNAERVRDRSATRRKATGIVTELEALRGQGDPNPEDLAWTIEKAERILTGLMEHQIQAPEPEPSPHKERLEASIFKAKRILLVVERNREARVAQPSAAAHPSPNTSIRVRQTPPLPTFDGGPGWPTFWGLFRAAVHDQQDLTDAEKIVHLLPLLRGQASQAVSGFEPSAANYQTIISILERRFHHPEWRREDLMTKLIALKPFPEPSAGTPNLRAQVDELTSTIRELEALGVRSEEFSAAVRPTLEGKLPPSWRVSWSRKKMDNPRLSLSDLITFIEREMEVLEEAFRSKITTTRSSREATHATTRGQARTLTTSTSKATNDWTCAACHTGKHGLRVCPEFIKLSPQDRSKVVKEGKLCYKCLGPHPVAQCSSHACPTCNMPHHSLLCFKGTGSFPPPPPSSQHQEAKAALSATATASAPFGVRVHQQSAVVVAQGGKGSRSARLLFDSGSDTTYIRQDLADALGLRRTRSATFACVGFQGRAGAPKRHAAVLLSLQSRSGGPLLELEAWIVPTLCAPLPTRAIPSHPALSTLFLADDFKAGPVDILVGSDAMNRFLLWNQIPLTAELRAIETVFGFVLHGPTQQTPRTSTNPTTLRITRLWEQDLLGLIPEDEPTLPSPTWNAEDGRYQMPLLWINDSRPVTNRKAAWVRTDRMTSRLDNEAFAFYDNYFQEKRAEDVVEITSPTAQHQEFFLPHRVVKTSSKLRPVFDGSAKDGIGRPLNEYLSSGPSLLTDLFRILVRFRCGAAALQADIKGAFHQVGVTEEDRPFLKFWWGDSVFRYRRVPFGITCSPFMLMATVRHHLAGYTDGSSYASSIYMDDICLASQDQESAARHLERLHVIFREAGMELHKSRVSGDVGDPLKILGLIWDTASDTLAVPIASDSTPRSKRSLLSTLAKTFDPLGLLAPWIIRGKILFQMSWKLNLPWDDPLPEHLQQDVQSWWAEEKKPESLSVVRFAGVPDGSQLVIFCDASPLAYCTAVYLRTPPSTLLLLCSRARVAPVSSTLTIPRMELLGATMAAMLARCISDTLNLATSKIQFFTDSMDVLYWIKSKKLHKPFVENRLRVIRSHSEPSQWSHVPGILNPADLGTRGLSLSQLRDCKLWWEGPNLSEIAQASTSADAPSSAAQYEERVNPPTEVLLSTADPLDEEDKTPVIDLSRYSSWSKASRIVAYVLRFVDRLRSKVSPKQVQITVDNGLPGVDEINRAQTFIIRIAQEEAFNSETMRRYHNLRPFQDGDQIFRIRPRTLEDPLILIPPGTELARLVTLHYHVLSFHLGTSSTSALLSSRFHLSRGEIRRYVQGCRRCRRFRGLPFRGPEGELPPCRREFLHPFSVTGADFFGPILVHGAKRYVLLLTCSSTRAVHLELVQTCSADHTSLALRRFIALRGGHPHTIMSDNAPTFRQLAGELKGQVKWTFIPEASPWWGGFWERLVGLVKRALKITLHNQKLNITQMTTILHELAHFINLRPLTPGDDGCPLTPSHFLYGLGPSRILNPQPSSPVCLTRAWSHRRQIALHLQSRFYREYLVTLRQWRRSRKGFPVRIPHPGDVVLVEEDGPRRHWPMAVVEELIQGRDGTPRAAYIRTSNSHLTRRPFQRLYLLEDAPSTVA